MWWHSLPLRVLVSTLGLSIIVMLLVGIVLMRQATLGILEAKKEASLNEAAGVYTVMQKELRRPESRGAAVHESLSQLADLADAQGAQYRIVIQGPALNLVSTGVEPESVPAGLRDSVLNSTGMFITSTQVTYTDTTRAPDPGFAIGTSLIGATGERYPVYYIFPLTTEVQILQGLQGAVAAAGALLVLALGLIAYLVTQQIARPVRRASSTALRLASGKLDERMQARGTDDIARLARSMNQMAGQLQQRIRELETLSTVQQRFVSDVSHELRTPLTTIKMASEVIYDSRSDFAAPVARSAELMNSEIERFDGLLADLLEISRFDAGAAVLALDEVNLAELVRDEVVALQSMAVSMGTSLTLNVLAENTRSEVDPRRIRRIVCNLLTNAIEHGESRPIFITVAADEAAVAIAVRDYGVGFSAEDSSRVFERFWRADPSRNRLVGGSGLGLAIAQEDARLHEGSLTAWGRPGGGAQFCLTLPRTRDQQVLESPLPAIPADEVDAKEV